DEWDGNAESHAVWRDTEFKIEGPAVGEIQSIFMDNWIRLSSEVLHGPDYFPTLTNVGNIAAQAFKSGPKDGAENARLMYLYSIAAARKSRSEEHTSELQSLAYLVCRLLLEKKKHLSISVILHHKH